MIGLQLQREELESQPRTTSYEVIVLGGGPGGLTAGLYASRAGLRTLLLEKQVPGGQVATTDLIENYPCCPEGISGSELMARITAQARRFGLQTENAAVQGLTIDGDVRVVHTDRGDFQARAVIIATGAHPAMIGVPGEEKFRSRGVSYCATCDGPFYRDRTVAVVGGGDSAVQEALFLARFAAKVVIIHRRETLRATAVLQERAFANPKIEFLWNRTVAAIEGGDAVERLILQDTRTGVESALAVDGVFVYVGQRPNTGFLRGVVALDPQGYILTDEEMRTNVPGILAAGDVRRKTLRQMVTATGDGAVAAHSADLYLAG